LERGFYQNDTNTTWAGWFANNLPSGLAPNTLMSVGQFNNCTLHLFPGWVAFGYLNRNPETRMDLDAVAYTGSSAIRALTYLIVIVNQSEVSYNSVNTPALISGARSSGSGSGSRVEVPFPLSVPNSVPATALPLTPATGSTVTGQMVNATIKRNYQWSCPAGYTLSQTDNNCYLCPTGYTLTGKICQSYSCPTGSVLVPPASCQPYSCPPGRTLIGTSCVM
jgi:hypothetical protein